MDAMDFKSVFYGLSTFYKIEVFQCNQINYNKYEGDFFVDLEILVFRIQVSMSTSNSHIM